MLHKMFVWRSNEDELRPRRSRSRDVADLEDPLDLGEEPGHKSEVALRDLSDRSHRIRGRGIVQDQRRSERVPL